MRALLATPARRRAAWWALVAGVTVAHVLLADRFAAELRIGQGAADSTPRRIEVAFVRELAPAAPPAPPAATAAPRPRRAAARAPQRAASAPAKAASAPAAQQAVAANEPVPPADAAPREPPADPPVSEPTAVAEAAAAAASAPPADPAVSALPADAAASAARADPTPAAAVASAAPTDAAVPFEWPPSTRLAYSLEGNYRGPVEGSAQVEWLRRDDRYQVHLDVRIGPSFAPLVARRMSSDGLITEQGLKPVRYDEETRVALAEPRRATVAFEDTRIVLANAKEQPRPEGVQDTASQFVQMTWLFTTRPQRLAAGQTVEVPLALPRRVERWTYDVVGEEPVDTPAGPIGAFYVKPRREARKGGDLVVEAWYAPTLQYLPVRLRIRQDAETWVDLRMLRLPWQEAPVTRR
jgi:hypothetical protein